MAGYREIVKDALLRCKGKTLDNDTFSQIFAFATENINGYIDYFNLKGKSLLTLGSSADQAINAAAFGARDITIIDINLYVRFYFYFKVASIIALNLEEFDKFYTDFFVGEGINNNIFHEYLFTKIKSVLKELDPESYDFWDKVFGRNKPIKVRSGLFIVERCGVKKRTPLNPYLTKKGYAKAKERLSSINITFVNQNAVRPELIKKYDNIWLLDLYKYLEKEMIEEMFENMKALLNDEGKLMFTYIRRVTEARIEEVKAMFKEENLEDFRFPGVSYLLNPSERQYEEDAILIYQKH